MNDFERLSEKILKNTKQPTEVFFEEQVKKSTEAKNGKINSTSTRVKTIASIRVIKKGYWGFADTTKLNIKNLQDTLKRALKDANDNDKNASVKDLPTQPKKLRKIKRDKKLEKIHLSDLIPEFSENLQNYSTRKHVHSLNGVLTTNQFKWLIANNTGLKLNNSSYEIRNSYNTTIRDKKQNSHWYGKTITRAKNARLKPIIKQAYNESIALKNPFKPRTGKYNLLLTPEVSYELIEDTILKHAKTVNVKKELNYLQEKKKQFTKKLTITDNPWKNYSHLSTPFDDEGVPTKKTKIIAKGCLKTPLNTLQMANKYGEKLTGNATRHSANFPRPDYYHINVKQGVEKLNALQEQKDTLEVYDVLGLHQFNHSTGDLVLTINNALNEKRESVTGLAMATNIKDLLKDSRVELSKKQETNAYYSIPWMLVKNVKLA